MNKKHEWVLAVLKRDDYKCQNCHARPEDKLPDTHHIKSKEQYPEFMYDVDNGLTLCHSCHLSVHHKGKTISDAHKKAVSDAHIGKSSWNKGLPAWNRGAKGIYSLGTISKMSEAKKGKPLSKDHRMKLSASWNSPGFSGHRHSDETKKKMSQKRDKENNPFYGKRHSEATRIKISESLKRRNKENKI